MMGKIMQNKMRDIYNLVQASRIDFRLGCYIEIMFCQPGPLKCMRCYKRSTESQERVYVIKQEGFEQLRQDETRKKITRFIKNGGNELLSPLIGREALGSIRRRSSRRRRRRRRRPNIAITHVGLHSWPVAGSCQIISTLNHFVQYISIYYRKDDFRGIFLLCTIFK